MSMEPSEVTAVGSNRAVQPTSRPLHPRSFKLRFASQREPGRSDVSAVKPLALPATVTGKFYTARGAKGAAAAAREAAALARVRDMFRLGPRERLAHPATSSHEYGWWSTRGGRWREARWLHHHICDSPWLKERLRVLATDASFKRS